MRARIVLLVALAVVTALVVFYAGWSTNDPTPTAEPAVSPPSSSLGHTQAAGAARSRAPVATTPKPSPPNPSTPKAAIGHSARPGQGSGTPPTSPPPRPTGPVRFGQVATTPSDDTLDTATSPDRRALSTTFSEFEVVADPAAADPGTSKAFAMTLPLTNGATGDVLGFHVSGFAITNAGATARLTLRGGGKVKVRDIPTDSDIEIVESLWLPATPGTTYRLSVILEVHKDAAGKGDGFINAVSIESEIS